MKRIKLILLYSLFPAILLNAQKDVPLNLPKLDNQIAHFGYSLGLNMMDFTIRPSDLFIPSYDTVYAVEVGRYVGFNINMISNLRLATYLDVRFLPGLIFGQRNLEYKYIKNGEFRSHNMMIESTFLDFPIYLKYRAARISNWRPFIIGGVSGRIDLAAQKKINPAEQPKIRLKPVDAYYEVGIGADFFLEYFMFGIELKSSWGIFNVIQYDNTQFSEYYKRLNSHMIILAFHFEGGKIDKIKWWN
ncbi:MAG: porin family protein [Bacteroidales bacterium]|nr:porin family protein [Bacteroidales bacterium]